jgi:RAQPRD family integrative conjugative element protein
MYGLSESLMRIHWLACATALAFLFSSSSVLADADAEREALARLIHEINAIAPLIASAESQANPDARIRFRYDWLRQDLARIRAGLQEHIDAPRSEPRTFPPLRGDYRQ